MRAIFCASLALGLVGCASSWRPSAERPVVPALERGWFFVEDSKEALSMEASVAPVSYSAPVLAGELLVAGSDRFGVMVFHKRTGQLVWRKRMPEEVAAQPLVQGERLFVGTTNGSMHSLDLAGGAEKWQVSLTGPVQGEFLLAFDRLFVATADGALHALDPGTGKLIWSYRRSMLGGSTIRGGGRPAAISGRIWMGFSDGALVALDPQTGALETEKVFRDNLKFLDLDAKVVGWRGGLLVSTYDGKLRYLRPDASTIWEFDAGGARTPLVSEQEVVYLPSSDGTVYALRGSTGKEIWRHALRRGVPTSLSLVDGKRGQALVVTSSEEWVSALDPATGQLRGRISLGKGSGSYAPVAVDGREFYVLSAYSRIYQLRLN